MEETMASSEVGQILRGMGSKQERSREEELVEEKRVYNRSYMRRWRADPRHAAREQLNRRRSYRRSKMRPSRKPLSGDRDSRGELFCGFCRKRRPIMLVTRLKSPAGEASRYVEIRIPYCGQC
jgi:hypothetical protein